jgi:hypothetical protein
MSHTFAVGDAVAYLDRTIGTSLTCNITKVMPVERYGTYYHIRSLVELFDRSVPAHTLTRIAPTAADDVFGRGA